MRLLISFVLILGLSPAVAQIAKDAKILVIGDSMMAWNSITGRSIPHVLSRQLKRPVKSFAVVGATFGSISKQFQGGPWDWVIVNGGANDLMFKCSCEDSACKPVMAKLVSADGRNGAMPQLAKTIRETGAKVMFVGYHRARQINSPARQCGNDLDAMDTRLAAMAKRQKGVYFSNMQNVFPAGDTSFYTFDRVHPSAKGSRTMAFALEKSLRKSGLK